VAGPEDRAAATIDDLLDKAGWHVVEPGDPEITVLRSTAVRNFFFKPGRSVNSASTVDQVVRAGVFLTKDCLPDNVHVCS
jgi:hypothetical protein